MFSSDARIAFGRAITEAEKQENQGRLQLLRWRPADARALAAELRHDRQGWDGTSTRPVAGKIETVTLPLQVMGTYGALAPMGCTKSRKILDGACEYIAREEIGKGIPGYVNALGLLASGNATYLPMVREFARKLRPQDAYGMSSWNMGYMNIFLSEYYLLTNDREVLPELRHMALYLANGQSQVGTWGHGNVLPNGLLGGYGAMCNPSLVCAVSLLLNRKCGIDDPVVNRAIHRSEIFFSSYVDKGNIPYGDHSPRDVHDSNGRCSLAVIFFDLLDNPDAYNFFARMTVASYGEREEGHTGNYWSFLWGPLGAMRAGPAATAAFIREQEWFFDLERRWDGGFTYQGGANMTGSEHTTPGWDTTGARVLMYAMSLQKIHITGKGLNVEKALVGKALEDTLFTGSGYSTWMRQGLVDQDPLDRLPVDQLLEYLVTWSPPFRIRVGKALARKEADLIPALGQMLDSGRDPSKPFCLMVNPHQPHCGGGHRPGRMAPDEYYDRLPSVLPRPKEVDAETFTTYEEQYRHYYAMILSIDDMLGEVISGLEQRGLLDSTILVFTSDHGTHLGTHPVENTNPYWTMKRPFDTSVRVPLVIHWPLGFSGGRRCDTLTAPVDLLPTFCGLCGIRIPSTVEGLDLSTSWLAERDFGQQDAVLMMNFAYRFSYPTDGWEWRGIRSKTHTYARFLSGETYLFDNRRDPFQQDNERRTSV